MWPRQHGARRAPGRPATSRGRAHNPDQLKSGLTKACRYEPSVQRTYEELADHYGTTVLPARPAHPRDKPKVEVGVQIVQRWVTGLVRYFVLFVVDLETRRVQVAGIVRQPHGAWMKQFARSLTDGVDGFLTGKRYLIHDRDPLFTDEFRDVLRAAGVKCLKLPAQSPDLNAYAERFVLSIKSECLNRIVPLGERHLRLAVTEFVEHCHRERNHQGLDNQLLMLAAGQRPRAHRSS